MAKRLKNRVLISTIKMKLMLPVIVGLMLCSSPVKADAEKGVAPAGDPQSTPCQGLRPYENIDELLLQFYINLDSGCLFKIPLDDLEKIWGVKILDDYKYINQDYNRDDFIDKPYNTDKDAFYIILKNGGQKVKDQRVSFKIRITKEYRKRYGALFPHYNFPKLIPKPRVHRHNLPSYKDSGYRADEFKGNEAPFSSPIVIGPKGDYDFSMYSYYWFNSNKSNMMQIYSGNSIEIKNFVPPGLK